MLSPSEMAAADRRTIRAGTSDALLMERAGRAVVRAVVDSAGGRYGRRAAVVCGKGNNGGDGFVAARLALREGLTISCLFVGNINEVKGAAAHHLELLRRAGVHVRPFSERWLQGPRVIVDALFGTGFHGAAGGEAANAIEAINRARAGGASVVAVDIPSGVDGATGAVNGPAVETDVTVTMAAEKIGTAVGPGAARAGEVRIADIGIETIDTGVRVAEANDVVSVLPRRAPDAHKRSGGSVAIIGGST